MGVDYSANFGFGVKVIQTPVPRQWLIDNEYEEDDADDLGLFREYLDEVLQSTRLRYFEVGSSSYGGDGHLVVYDPLFEDGLTKGNYDINIRATADYITSTLDSLLISYEGQPTLIGGLHIW